MTDAWAQWPEPWTGTDRQRVMSGEREIGAIVRDGTSRTDGDGLTGVWVAYSALVAPECYGTHYLGRYATNGEAYRRIIEHAEGHIA